MVEFNKKIEEERSKEEQKKPEEMTDAEKEEWNNKRAEENIKKLREFERLMKEAPKFVYNTNVFKNVKFAISEDEVKKDELIVEELAKFLKDQAVPKLIKDL